MLELLYKSHSSNVHAGIITYKQPLLTAQILLWHDNPYTTRVSSLPRLRDETNLDKPNSVGLL